MRRRQEIREKTDVSDAAKLLFDDLTDICFLSKHSVGFGIVRIGKPLLAERLGKSVPTITRAQKELAAGDIWTRTGWHEGHEITIWFLRGIADSQMEFDRFTEGVTKRPQTREAPRVEAARNGHGQFCKINGNANFQENGKLMVDSTGHTGQSRRGATVNPAVATPSKLTGGNRQNHGAGPVNFDRGERSTLTEVNGQNHRLSHSKGDGGSTAGMTGYKEDKDIGKGEKAESPPDLALKEWIKDLKNRKPALYPRELQDIKTKLLEQRRTTPGVEARLFINKKIKSLDELMLGPTLPDKAPKRGPVHVAAKPIMSPEEMEHHWKKAKKNLSPGFQQKAAASAAART